MIGLVYLLHFDDVFEDQKVRLLLLLVVVVSMNGDNTKRSIDRSIESESERQFEIQNHNNSNRWVEFADLRCHQQVVGGCGPWLVRRVMWFRFVGMFHTGPGRWSIHFVTATATTTTTTTIDIDIDIAVTIQRSKCDHDFIIWVCDVMWCGEILVTIARWETAKIGS